MSRRHYLKPDAEDLRSGNILPIYTNYQEEEGFEGYALLIERQEGWRIQPHYVRAEQGGTEDKDPVTVNWSTQRWLVEFVDGPQKGFRTHRYISHFLCIDAYLYSGVDLYHENEEE